MDQPETPTVVPEAAIDAVLATKGDPSLGDDRSDVRAILAIAAPHLIAAAVAAVRADLAAKIEAPPAVVAIREDTGMSVPAIKAVLQSVAPLIRGRS